VETHQLAFVHGSELAAWLRGRTPELDHPGLEEIAQAAGSIASHGRRGSPGSRAA